MGPRIFQILFLSAAVAAAATPDLERAAAEHDRIMIEAQEAYRAAVHRAKTILVKGLQAELDMAMAVGNLDHAIDIRAKLRAAQDEASATAPPAPAVAGALRFPYRGRWTKIEKGARVWADKADEFPQAPPYQLAGKRFYRTTYRPTEFQAVKATRVWVVVPRPWKGTNAAMKASGFENITQTEFSLSGGNALAWLWARDLERGDKVKLPAAAVVVSE